MNEYVPTMIASATAGSIARIFCHPIDTIKARLQARNTQFQYSSISNAFSSISRTEGLKAFYRGFGITFWGSMPASCMYFTSYEISKAKLSPLLPHSSQLFVHFSSGMIAETFACIVFVPIDVIKERMQIQSKNLAKNETSHSKIFYKDSFDAISKIIKSEGVIGFYRGYGATISSFGPYSAFYFVFYEALKSQAHQTLKTDNLRFQVTLLLSCCAGGAASWITNPLDLVKLRLQVQRAQPRSSIQYRNMFHGLYQVVREESVRGLFKGSTARMAFHATSSAVIMTLFEEFKKAFQF